MTTEEPRQVELQYTPSLEQPADDAPIFFTEEQEQQQYQIHTPKKDNLRIVVLLSSILYLIGNLVWCGWGVFTESLPAWDYASIPDIACLIIRVLGFVLGTITAFFGIICALQNTPKQKRRLFTLMHISGLIAMVLLELLFWIVFFQIMQSSEEAVGWDMLVIPLAAVITVCIVNTIMVACSAVRLRQFFGNNPIV